MPASVSSASVIRVVVDLPFVPTTCTAGYASCGSLSSASRARIRSSPKPSAGHGLSEAIQSVADRVKLAPVALELRALGLHDVLARIRHEPLVRQHLLAARDLSLEPRDLLAEPGTTVDLHALRPHDRVEDPRLVALERRAHSAPPEPLGCLLHAHERVGVARVRRVRLGPR